MRCSTAGQQEQVSTALEDDAELMTNTQLEEQLVGQPADVQAEIVRINTDARPLALQIALLVPILAGLGGLAQLLPDDARAGSGPHQLGRGDGAGLTTCRAATRSNRRAPGRGWDGGQRVRSASAATSAGRLGADSSTGCGSVSSAYTIKVEPPIASTMPTNPNTDGSVW